MISVIVQINPDDHCEEKEEDRRRGIMHKLYNLCPEVISIMVEPIVGILSFE